MTLTMTLSYDLELERQGTHGSLAAAHRGITVDDGGADRQQTRLQSLAAFHVRHRLAEFFGHDASPHTPVMAACILDTAFAPIPGH